MSVWHSERGSLLQTLLFRACKTVCLGRLSNPCTPVALPGPAQTGRREPAKQSWQLLSMSTSRAGGLLSAWLLVALPLPSRCEAAPSAQCRVGRHAKPWWARLAPASKRSGPISDPGGRMRQACMHRLRGAAGDSARSWPGRQPRAAGSWCQRAPAQGRGLPCSNSGTSPDAAPGVGTLIFWVWDGAHKRVTYSVGGRVSGVGTHQQGRGSQVAPPSQAAERQVPDHKAPL